MSIERNFRLKNGLRVFIQESHAAPVVAVQLWIRVGSADEQPSEAGIAHLLEHMMFKGTERRGVGMVAQEVDAAGGEINAYTSFDQTVYHITLASRHFDLGLDLLADMVQNSRIDAEELAREKEVVLEEVRRSLDSPSRVLDQSMFRTAFRSHPYGRPVIGYEGTVRGFQREDVLGFFHRWYTPDNMVLVVVGDVDSTSVKRQVTKTFKDFNRPPAPVIPRTGEQAQTAARFISLQQPVQESFMSLAFPIPAADHPDAPYLDLLALVLGQGESSRLVERIKNQQQLVNSIYAYAYTPREPGLFMVGSSFESGRWNEVYSAILEEFHQLRLAPVRSSELQKARSIVLSNRVYERETVDGQARKAGYYLLTYSSMEQEKAYFRAIEEATVDHLWRAARTWLQSSTLTLGTLLPREADLPDEATSLEAAAASLGRTVEAPAIFTSRREADTIRTVLPNGIRLLVKENHSVPLVAIRAVFEGGLRFETPRNNGSFHLLSQLLTRGTAHRGAYQIAHEVESLAGDLDAFAGRSAFGLRGEMLVQNLDRGMELFAEILKQPSFDPHELEKMKRLTLEAIRTQTDHPSGYVFRLLSESLYTHHPFRLSSLGTDTSVRSQTSLSLRRTWTRFATSRNMVLAIVGDVDPRDMESLAAHHLGDFPSAAPSFPSVPVEPPLKRSRIVHRHNEKQQLHLAFGWRGISLDHPDRYAMDVLSSVMAGQGGRLFMELRDRQSLAYSVSASSVESMGEGFFTIYMGTEPAKFAKARTGILEEVDKLLQSGITPQELDRAQRNIIGGYEIELQRSSAMCASLAFNECYGLGPDHYKEHPRRILHVTAPEVLEIARRYLSTEVYALASVGPLPDQEVS